MKITQLTFIAFFALGLPAQWAMGHGFNLQAVTDNGGNIVAVTAASESAFLDQSNVTAGPANLFLDSFGSTPYNDSSGNCYVTTEGFAQQPGSWPAYTATFAIVSPLIFSGGLDSSGGTTGTTVAVAASKGTFVDVFDDYAGNTDPNYPHPGASFGDVYPSGSLSYAPGFGVSLLDPHELEKDIYLASGGTQTYGEFGFAFTVTVSFSGGRTITSGPLVDTFAISDPSLGDFTSASTAQQDRATSAIYGAVMGSTSMVWATATSGAWSNGANWIGGLAPAGNSHTAVFAQPTSTMLTIALTGTQTAGGLYFSNTASATAGYLLSGNASSELVLSSTAAPLSITVASGSDAVDVPVLLTGDLTISPSAGSALAIGGAIRQSGGARAVSLDDAGTLILSGSNSFTGGMTVSAGSLVLDGAAALAAGNSLVIGSGISDGAEFASPASNSDVHAATAPEPPTALLCMVGMAVALAARYSARPIWRRFPIP